MTLSNGRAGGGVVVRRLHPGDADRCGLRSDVVTRINGFRTDDHETAISIVESATAARVTLVCEVRGRRRAPSTNWPPCANGKRCSSAAAPVGNYKVRRSRRHKDETRVHDLIAHDTNGNRR